MRILILFLLLSNMVYSQKVTITPISFQNEFELKNAGMNNVLKDYTEFASSPFKKIPTGFTLSDASVFYKFDTLNCSLFIKKREDVDSLIYYRDCEDGRWCFNLTFQHYIKFESSFQEKNKYKFRQISCCDKLPETDTSALIYNNEWVDFHSFLDLDGNLPNSLISENYVTNSEYDEFIRFVKDSIRRYEIKEKFPNEFSIPNSSEDNRLSGRIDYLKKINFNDKRFVQLYDHYYYPDHEKYYRQNEWDYRKLNYKGINLKYTINAPEDECTNCKYLLNADVCGKGLKNCKHITGLNNFSKLISHTQFFLDRKKPATNDEVFRRNILRSLISTNISPDSLLWIQNNEKAYRIWMSENYSVQKSFSTFPVTGVNYWQAKSFLSWKTYEHNKLLIRTNQKYRVIYTLPLPDESRAISVIKATLPSIDFNKYVITNGEYEKFVAYIIDSNVLNLKIWEGNDKVLNKLTTKTYYSDGIDERAPEEWLHVKKYYENFYYKSKSEWKKDTLYELFSQLLVSDFEIDYLKYDGIDTRKLFYRYYWKYYEKDTIIKYHYLDLSTNYYQYHHVYGTVDRSDFIIMENVNIYPGYNAKGMSKLDGQLIAKRLNEIKNSVSFEEFNKVADTLDPNSLNFIGSYRFEEDTIIGYKHKLYDFKSSPDSPITAITYEQAKAYYHWKNEVPYIPTKEEWNLIKQGINPYEEKELEVPGPFFRYVIRVYPVRDN